MCPKRSEILAKLNKQKLLEKQSNEPPAPKIKEKNKSKNKKLPAISKPKMMK